MAHWLRRFIVLLGLVFSVHASAEPDYSRYVADIELQTQSQLIELLVRAETLLLDGKIGQEGEAAVVLVLHGPVLRSLLKPNYSDSKVLVDRAATLSALGVLDIKACRSWMGKNDVDAEQLQPFVQTVSYGPGEVTRLIREQGYITF